MAGQEIRFGTVHGPVQTGAGTQYSAGRDQYLAGRDMQITQSEGGTDLAVSEELVRLRDALSELRLTVAERAAAERELDDAEQALISEKSDSDAAGTHLRSLTTVLKEAGALAGAGNSIVESLGKLATWLGPVGAGILALL